jgi:hypothetical protein
VRSIANSKKSPLPLFSKEGVRVRSETSPFEKGGRKGDLNFSQLPLKRGKSGFEDNIMASFWQNQKGDEL